MGRRWHLPVSRKIMMIDEQKMRQRRRAKPIIYSVNKNLEKVIVKEKREVEYFIKKLKEDNPHTNNKSFNELRNWWKNADHEEKKRDKMEYMRQLTIKEKRLVKLGNDKVQPYKPFGMPDFYPKDTLIEQLAKKMGLLFARFTSKL